MMRQNATLWATKTKRALLFLGAPGVGKSTQTELLVKALPGVMCISTGNLVRKLDKKVKDNLPLNEVEKYAAQTLEIMHNGGLMDDKAVYALLMAHLSKGGEGYQEYSQAHTIILDGVIKEPANIHSFNAALAVFNQKSENVPMHLAEVVYINAPRTELLARQQARVNNAKEKRPDDNVETYCKRLDAYYAVTENILGYYKNNNLYQLTEVDGSSTLEITTQKLLDVINTQTKGNFHAKQSSNSDIRSNY